VTVFDCCPLAVTKGPTRGVLHRVPTAGLDGSLPLSLIRQNPGPVRPAQQRKADAMLDHELYESTGAGILESRNPRVVLADGSQGVFPTYRAQMVALGAS
jgi:hypothetical protein